MRNLILTAFLILLSRLAPAQSTWFPVPGAPSEPRIEDVSFISPLEGFLEANDTIYKTNDGGNTWSVAGTFFPGYVRSIEFLNSTVGFIGTLQQFPTVAAIFRTTDGGQTWINQNNILPNPPQWGICGIAHRNNQVVAVGSVIAEANVYVSQNAGSSWTHINLDTLASALIDVFIVDSLEWLVCGKSEAASGNKATILRTLDGGITWTRAALSSLINTYCWKIFLQDNGYGYTSIESFTGAAVFKTINNGATWTETVFSGATVIDLGAVAMMNDTLGWLGAQHGPGGYETTDGGTTWIPFPNGNYMNRIVIPDGQNPLCVGTTVFRYGNAVAVPELVAQSREHHLNIYPNPGNGWFTLQMDLKEEGSVAIVVTDMQGVPVHPLLREYYSSGIHKLTIDLTTKSSGIYFVQVSTNRRNFGMKISKK
jgi:photosystem II stability/assembly factor-like uncharacterized protein